MSVQGVAAELLRVKLVVDEAVGYINNTWDNAMSDMNAIGSITDGTSNESLLAAINDFDLYADALDNARLYGQGFSSRVQEYLSSIGMSS